MKRSEMVLIISEKLQKQMHLINSEKQRNCPKMLCDNLATRVLTAVEEAGMQPPNVGLANLCTGNLKYSGNPVYYSIWESEDNENI